MKYTRIFEMPCSVVAPVWFIVDNGALAFNTGKNTAKGGVRFIRTTHFHPLPQQQWPVALEAAREPLQELATAAQRAGQPGAEQDEGFRSGRTALTRGTHPPPGLDEAGGRTCFAPCVHRFSAVPDTIQIDGSSLTIEDVSRVATAGAIVELAPTEFLSGADREARWNRVVAYSAPDADLLDEVQRFANVLKGLGVQKGDRVAIYMPMIPELPVAMLACARIGAPHSVVFGGFSADSLSDRINDAITALDDRIQNGLAVLERADRLQPRPGPVPRGRDHGVAARRAHRRGGAGRGPRGRAE